MTITNKQYLQQALILLEAVTMDAQKEILQFNAVTAAIKGTKDAIVHEERQERLAASIAAIMNKQENGMTDIPAAACNRCGGWTPMGGMSQYSNSLIPITGRTGCTCT